MLQNYKKGKFIKTIIIVNQCRKYKHLIIKLKAIFVQIDNLKSKINNEFG